MGNEVWATFEQAEDLYEIDFERLAGLVLTEHVRAIVIEKDQGFLFKYNLSDLRSFFPLKDKKTLRVKLVAGRLTDVLIGAAAGVSTNKVWELLNEAQETKPSFPINQDIDFFGQPFDSFTIVVPRRLDHEIKRLRYRVLHVRRPYVHLYEVGVNKFLMPQEIERHLEYLRSQKGLKERRIKVNAKDAQMIGETINTIFLAGHDMMYWEAFLVGVLHGICALGLDGPPYFNRPD
ncbi:hypothetical protein TRP8649_01889 [Pelagimonas phthalicica]|uniref:Uncharacterized protein n=2 Tax=Pelagimonas phthalicica TaxID=1037362 RepID=A0A238JAZ8_9RHOB|nr:hypothetical protein CLV87_0183 [Pelagimonas phthalicica]SMX27779.1 hypothetical protein TRP8649_01889 [Pelagimonas phthalicica]